MQLIKFSSVTEAQNAALSKLISYKVGYPKLWSSDSGRALTGAYNGTLIGKFPKLTIKVRAHNKTLYFLTSDTSVVSGKTYYTKSGGAYTAVSNPSTSGLSGYYERFTSREAEKALLSVFNSDFDNITYFDPWKDQYITKQFYFGDVAAEVKSALDSGAIKYGPIDVEIVATNKLT